MTSKPKSMLDRWQEAELAGRRFKYGKELRALQTKPTPKTIEVELSEPIQEDLAYCLAVWKRRGVALSRQDLFRMSLAATAADLRRQERAQGGLFDPRADQQIPQPKGP